MNEYRAALFYRPLCSTCIVSKQANWRAQSQSHRPTRSHFITGVSTQQIEQPALILALVSVYFVIGSFSTLPANVGVVRQIVQELLSWNYASTAQERRIQPYDMRRRGLPTVQHTCVPVLRFTKLHQRRFILCNLTWYSWQRSKFPGLFPVDQIEPIWWVIHVPVFPKKHATGSMKISRRNPCSPFFSVSYSINRHKII